MLVALVGQQLLAARLVESGERWGVAAICIGVGQGISMIVERVES